MLDPLLFKSDIDRIFQQMLEYQVS